MNSNKHPHVSIAFWLGSTASGSLCLTMGSDSAWFRIQLFLSALILGVEIIRQLMAAAEHKPEHKGRNRIKGLD